MLSTTSRKAWRKKCKANRRITYRSRDQKSWEEVPHIVESWWDDSCYAFIRSQANCHHTIEREVEQREVHEEQVPEELGSSPLKSNHGIDQHTIYQSLDKDVWQFNQNLQKDRKKLLGSWDKRIRVMELDFKDISSFTFMYLTWKARTIKINYLSKCIWQSWIHASRSFSIEDCSFHHHHWLNRTRVLHSKIQNCSIHWSHGIEQILLFFTAPRHE